ncbi:MAG: hypothetical protein ACOC1F_13255 [Myxococcota bacterium]
MLIGVLGVLSVLVGCTSPEPFAKIYESSLTKGADVPLAPPDTLDDSVHAHLDCSDCHAPKKGQDAGAAKGSEDDETGWEVAACGHCHTKEAKDYAASIHGKALEGGKADSAHCSNCHGNHNIKPVDDRDSPVFKLRLPFTCARCHKNPELAKRAGIKAEHAVDHYLDSIHGPH